MIMEWKKAEQAFHAKWRGIQYILSANSNGRWFLQADGKRVATTWPTPKKAMEAIDSRQQRIVIALSREMVSNAQKN